MQVSVDSLNTYRSLGVVKVTAQSEQKIYYFEVQIMNKGNELSVAYPNGDRFQQLAIDNTETEFALKQLDLQHKANLVTYQAKLAELEQHRAQLYEHTNRKYLSDYEERKRRRKIRELTEKIKAFELPEPVNLERYRVQRQMLEYKLRETAHLNATILNWQAQGVQN